MRAHAAFEIHTEVFCCRDNATTSSIGKEAMTSDGPTISKTGILYLTRQLPESRNIQWSLFSGCDS